MPSPPAGRARCALAALALACLPCTSAAQYEPASSFHRAEIGVHTSAAVRRVIGWEFTAASTCQVTALGVFDTELSFAPQGGLATPKDVGLWSAEQVLLAAATVPAGQGGTLCQDGFRYVSIPPATLHAGTRYVVGALWPDAGADGDPDGFDDYPDTQNSQCALAFHPAIAFVQPRYRLHASSLAFPDGALPGMHSFLGAVGFRIGAGACEANPPADLVTTFASDNGYAGSMFDLRAEHPAGLTVEGWQVNLGDVVPQSAQIEISIYWRHGSYAGATDVSAGWRHLGTAAVQSWGTNQPTPVPIGGLALHCGETVGVYVFVTRYEQHPPPPGVPLLHYTGIGPAAPSYADPHLALTGGAGKGAPPFLGPTFADRMWNGGVLYRIGAEPFASYCSGDGSAAPCPCGNAGAAGEGCANETGSGAILSAAGGASVSDGGTTLHGIQLVPAAPALFFQAEDVAGGGAGVPFGDGLRCSSGALVRLELALVDPFGAVASSVDLAATGSVAPGERKRYQLWYRDPLPSPCGSGFNLSQGLEITYGP